MASTFSGRVWKFGDDINTDLIIPGYALFMPPEEQRRQCFSANRPGWVDEVRPGDVLHRGPELRRRVRPGPSGTSSVGSKWRASSPSRSTDSVCATASTSGCRFSPARASATSSRRATSRQWTGIQGMSRTRPRARASKAFQCIRLFGTSSKPGESRTCSAGRDTSLRRNRRWRQTARNEPSPHGRKMTVTASVTEQLAEWIVKAQYDDVPDPGALRVKERFIDSLGVQFAGLSVSTGQIISQWVRAQGAKEESSLVGVRASRARRPWPPSPMPRPATLSSSTTSRCSVVTTPIR